MNDTSTSTSIVTAQGGSDLCGGEKSSELLPCPFCGKQPHSNWNGASYPDDDSGYWAIECCGAFVHEDDEETARKLWNTRATPISQSPAGDQERIRELEKALEWIKACKGAHPENIYRVAEDALSRKDAP